MIVREWFRRVDGASVETRVEAVEALIEAWLDGDLDPLDREEIEDALMLCLDDGAFRVRMALAEGLARSPRAPRHVMLSLAADLPAIAMLVLQRSPVLGEAELVDIVAVGSAAYQCAVAGRPQVPAGLSAAIAEVAGAEACAVLADNPGADLGAGALRRIAERHGDDARLRTILLRRPDLPAAIRQMLIARLGSVLGDLAVSRFSMGAERAGRCVREACDKATVSLASEADEDDLSPLVAHLRRRGELTPSLLLRALCGGGTRFVEAAVAELSGMPVRRVRSLLAEGRPSSLRALFVRTGMTRAIASAFVVAVDIAREMAREGIRVDTPAFSRRMIEAVLARAADFEPGEADKLVVALRRLASEAARDAARERLEQAREELSLERSVSCDLEVALEAA